MDKSGIIFVKSWGKIPDALFSGIAYTTNSIIIGNEGFKKYKLANTFNPKDFIDGRFALFSRTGDSYVIKTDEMGQESIFYYNSGDEWAISNSFYFLLEELKRRGCLLNVKKSALIAPFVKHALCQQLVSNHTGIKEIKVLPLGEEIVINRAKKTFNIIKSDHGGEPVKHDDDYRSALIEFCVKWASRFASLISKKPEMVFMDLSGGYDSRVLLGLAIRSGMDLTKINIRSNKQYNEDYQIAKLLATTYGFNLSERSLTGIKANSFQAYNLWKYGNLGIYFPVYTPIFSVIPKTLHFHGAGGELHRSYYSKSASSLAKNLKSSFKNNEQYCQLSSEFLGAMNTLGADIDKSESMMEHYASFRSRFHFGRNWVRSYSSPIVTPLASGSLKSASDYLNYKEKNSGKLLCDLFYMLDPALAALPFDKSEKSFCKDMILNASIKNADSFFHGNIKELNIYEGECRLDASKDLSDYSCGSSIADCFLEDLKSNKEPAVSTGIINYEYYLNAKNMLIHAKRPVVDYLPASHIISIGEIARAAC